MGRGWGLVDKMGALGGWGLLALALLFGSAAALNRANKKPDSNIRHGKSKFFQTKSLRSEYRDQICIR